MSKKKPSVSPPLAEADTKKPPKNAQPRSSKSVTTMAFVFSLFGLSFVVAIVSVVAFRHRDALNVRYRELKQIFEPSVLACQDDHEQCANWASAGECEANPKYMLTSCRMSCGSCNKNSKVDKQSPVSLFDDDEEEEEEEEEEDIEEDEEDIEEYEEDIEEDEDEEDEEEEDDDDYTSAPKLLSASDSADTSCVDKNKNCAGWAASGECKENPGWMLENCQKSCKVCTGAGDAKSSCKDNHESCAFWASIDECKKNPGYMLENCKKSCKTCNAASEEEEEEQPKACKDRQPTKLCRARQKAGECEKNPGWMIVMCAASCNACDLLPQKKRCRPEVFNDPNYRYENALEKPGDLNSKFEHILATYSNVTVLSTDPYVIKLHNFVNELERNTLLGLTLPNIKRSTDQGKVDEDGIQEQVVSQGRTSENAWCLSECMQNPVVANLTDRISTLLQVPVANFESYQVLQYKLGQEYKVHHDSGDEDILDMSGPRILTFFIYFTEVEEGGETWFDKLGIKVKPEVGSAILWPSVLNSNPKLIDKRTTHAALPVIKGVKHAANVWVHMRDFHTPNLWGCTGSFD